VSFVVLLLTCNHGLDQRGCCTSGAASSAMGDRHFRDGMKPAMQADSLLAFLSIRVIITNRPIVPVDVDGRGGLADNSNFS